MPTIIHKIGPKIESISFKISLFYFPVSQIGQNLLELLQIGFRFQVLVSLADFRFQTDLDTQI